MRGWTLHKRKSTESVSFVVIATKLTKQTGERARSKKLDSNQDRHSLTLTRQGMHFITVHAESGGDANARDYRASQLQYLSRAYESAGGGACVLAGDFNLRQGEEQVLIDKGWRDVGRSDDWTWALGEFQTRYDRVYIHAGVYEKLECLRCMSLPGYIEARLSDHKPVCVEMRRTDIRAHTALPGAGNMQGTSPAGGEDSPEVVASCKVNVGGKRKSEPARRKQKYSKYEPPMATIDEESDIGPDDRHGDDELSDLDGPLDAFEEAKLQSGWDFPLKKPFPLEVGEDLS